MKSFTWKKVSSSLFILLMIALCLFLCQAGAQAAAKPSLSRKSLTIKAGKTKTLSVRHASRKVKWSTSNKKIAKIKKKSGKHNQKVVIKAGKKAGKCYIKAKIGKKTLKCKITVKKKAAAVSPTTPDEQEPKKEATTEELAFTGFSLELLKKTIETDKKAGKAENLLISPDSVATALAMTEMGAAGQTLSEMESVLSGGISAEDYNKYLSKLNRRLMSSKAFIYAVSNSIWAQEGLVDVREDFLQKNKEYHDADFKLAPFNEQTVKEMNDWVYDKSRKMIDKIIDNLSKDARMVLINTVAFEGQWAEPFEKTAIKTDIFNSYSKAKQKVSMLRDVESYPYLELKGGKGFAKYYGKDYMRGEIAFVGLLPPENMDVDAYVQSLDAESFLNSWNNRKNTRVDLTLPKFKYDYGTEMGDILQDMGIKTAFTDDADFSRMADPTPETPALKISKVLHKTHIELDENGTKAAAATAVVMEKATAIFGDDPIKLNFNRPFVYALVDTTTGVPLFIGEVKSISK